MSGLYIHIPFCRKKCNYCNFHFSTRLDFKTQLVESIGKELLLRRNEIKNSTLETLYFGGGTPSLLSFQELNYLFQKIQKIYPISQIREITLEANPDDLTPEFLKFLKKETPVNRLSIGIQSFFTNDLKLMNRAHNSEQAENSIREAQERGFDNITIDLIYGGQTTTDEQWISNLEKALSLKVPHISSYALTVEPKTVFESQIRKGKIPPIDEDRQFRHFEILRNILTENNFIQYEFSNFGKEGFFSLHNTSYWQNKPYMGIGPSAHSFNGINKRSWNISNNIHYIKSLRDNILPLQEEILQEKDIFNEKIMLGLRTQKGISIPELEMQFSGKLIRHFYRELKLLKIENKVKTINSVLTVNPEFLFQTDGIISQFFFID